MANFKEYNQKQGMFLTLVPDELLESEHPARIVDVVVENLNLDEIYAYYSEVGNEAYHPKMMMKILFFGYQQGIFSGRKVENNLKVRADFIFLSGGQIPDFRTINLFRIRHKKVLPDLFAQVVLLCNKLGMIDFENLAIDGQKIRANASFKQNYNKKRLKKKYNKIKDGIEKLVEKEITEDFTEKLKEKRLSRLKKQKEELESLQKELDALNDDNASINKTERGAKIMTHKDRKIVPSHNNQSAVDGKYGVTVATQTTDNGDVADDLFTLVDKAEETLNKTVKNVEADCGFSSYAALEKMENEREEDFYVPDNLFEQSKKGNDDKKVYNKSVFKKKDDGCYYCPNDKKMIVKHVKTFDDGHTETVYTCKHCDKCKLKEKCTKGKSRTITVDSREKYRDKMREKLKSDKGREIYMKRQHIVEAGHGDDQKNKGWTQHFLRGGDKCSIEFMLIRIGSNLSKIIKYKASELLATA